VAKVARSGAKDPYGRKLCFFGIALIKPATGGSQNTKISTTNKDRKEQEEQAEQ